MRKEVLEALEHSLACLHATHWKHRYYLPRQLLVELARQLATMALLHNDEVLFESAARDLDEYFARFFPLCIVLLKCFNYWRFFETLLAFWKRPLLWILFLGGLLFGWVQASILVHCQAKHCLQDVHQNLSPQGTIRWWCCKAGAMNHDDVFQRVNGSATNFCPMVASKTFDPLEQDLPNGVKVDFVNVLLLVSGLVNEWPFCIYKASILGPVFFENLLGCVISDVLKHADCNKVAVYVTAHLVAGV